MTGQRRPISFLRCALAVLVAAITDIVQFLAGPLGWVGFDNVLDVVAMALTCLLVGFHILLLPTFVLEMIPMAGALPTWTACVVMVIVLKNRAARVPPPAAAPPAEAGRAKADEPAGPVIDV